MAKHIEVPEGACVIAMHPRNLAVMARALDVFVRSVADNPKADKIDQDMAVAAIAMCNEADRALMALLQSVRAQGVSVPRELIEDETPVPRQQFGFGTRH